jgi:hypothetical protein
MEERKRQKEEFSKRGSKVFNKRFQQMAELGCDEERKKKQKVTAAMEQAQADNDTFGMADEDWDAYRNISKE